MTSDRVRRERNVAAEAREKAWAAAANRTVSGASRRPPRPQRREERPPGEPVTCAWAIRALSVRLGINPGRREGFGQVVTRARPAITKYFSERGRLGFVYALQLAWNGSARRPGMRGQKPPLLTTAVIGRQHGLDARSIQALIAQARREAFGSLTDRQIRRLRPVQPRSCADCHAPLAPDVPPQRRYCAKCSTPAAYKRRSRARAAN